VEGQALQYHIQVVQHLMTTEYSFLQILKESQIMAKITKDKLVELIQESIEEYMSDSSYNMSDETEGDMEPESPCALAAAAEGEPMDLEGQVAELRDMMQQLMDMMGGQAMMELQASHQNGQPGPKEEGG
tara:strand:- start:2225 stop:2614 length:390 start_codon:yes stop_codon:yes gene_type:complete